MWVSLIAAVRFSHPIALIDQDSTDLRHLRMDHRRGDSLGVVACG